MKKAVVRNVAVGFFEALKDLTACMSLTGEREVQLVALCRWNADIMSMRQYCQGGRED
jgi:hypothetical protein